MKIFKPGDPNDLSNMVNRRIQEKNQKTAGVPEQTSRSTTASPHRRIVHQQAHTSDDLGGEFLGLLLKNGEGTHDPSMESVTHDQSALQEPLSKKNGTNSFHSSLKECREQKQNDKSTFNFSINNTLAGEVEVQGEFSNGKCVLNLRVPRALTVKEKASLTWILQTSLRRELDVDLEVRID